MIIVIIIIIIIILSPVLSGVVGSVHPADEISDEEQRVGDGERHQVVSGGGAAQAVRQGADDQAERVAQQPGRHDHAHTVEIAVSHGRLDRVDPGICLRRRRVVAAVVAADAGDTRGRHYLRPCGIHYAVSS